MNEWQFLAALIVPVIGFLGGLAQRERTPGQVRRLRESTTALKDLDPKSKAFAAVSDLVVAQASNLLLRESRRLNRFNLTLAVISSGLAGLATYGLSVWCLATWATPYGWVALTTSIVVGIVLILFVAGAFSTIFNPPAPPRPSKSNGVK